MQIKDVELQEQKKQAEKLLLEFFFDRKARRFNNELDKVQVIPGNDNGNSVVRNADLFDGDIYLDHTRLPDQKWNLFREKSPVPQRGSIFTHGFQLVFIMGYKFNVTPMFYEIWFDGLNNAYVLLDKFAAPVASNLQTLDDAVNQLVEIISQDNTKIKYQSLDTKEKRYLETLAKRNLKAAMESEVNEAKTALLESTGNSRLLISNMLNAQVTEYHETKMTKINQKWFFQRWGKFSMAPTDFMDRGIRGFFNRVILRNRREADFVIGFSLEGRVNVEIWYVRDLSGGNQGNGYYVFNLTSRELIAGDLNSIRQAYLAVGRNITLPTDIISKVK